MVDALMVENIVLASGTPRASRGRSVSVPRLAISIV